MANIKISDLNSANEFRDLSDRELKHLSGGMWEKSPVHREHQKVPSKVTVPD